MAGLAPFTKPGLAPLLALKPPPPAFGVILFGFGAPGTAGGLGAPGFGAILFLLFLLALLAALAAAPGAPGLLGVILGSYFFFFGLLNCDKSITCPVKVAPESFWY